VKIPHPELIRSSSVAYLRELGCDEEADILSRCKIEVGEKAHRYAGSTKIGLSITLRCRAMDVAKFEDRDSGWAFKSDTHHVIEQAIETVLPAEVKVQELSARSLLVDRKELEKTELERLIEAQIDLMIAVATGGPRIEVKNQEYKKRRHAIRDKLESLGESDPNEFEDLWAWYGRWSSGDLPSYQSRRDYVRTLYRDLREELAGLPSANPAEPSKEPTGWEKVDRTVDKIITTLAKARNEEEYQTVGLLCRECLVSLAQSVYEAEKHRPTDGIQPSATDAYRMLEAYFSSEFSGSENKALRAHAKASLNLANGLQHKRTAEHKDAALCSEATRTVINIVAITSGRR